MGLIPGKQALAIELVKIEGLSMAGASEKTGQKNRPVSESPVNKVNIHRSMKRMAAAIGED